MKEKNEESKGLKKLWAPWRMEYIEGIDTNEKKGCIFCDKPGQDEDEKNYIIYRSKTCFIILNIYPYNNGHLMIVPYKHTPELSGLDSETRLDLMNTIDIAMEGIKKVMRPDGLNLGVNFGRSAGAGITEHIHFHLVPRWTGDTNFMPVIGCTKVISESLENAYAKLKKAVEIIIKEKKSNKEEPENRIR